jgi:hypothetical protein
MSPYAMSSVFSTKTRGPLTSLIVLYSCCTILITLVLQTLRSSGF